MIFYGSRDLSWHESSTFLCCISLTLGSVFPGNDKPHLQADPRQLHETWFGGLRILRGKSGIPAQSRTKESLKPPQQTRSSIPLKAHPCSLLPLTPAPTTCLFLGSTQVPCPLHTWPCPWLGNVQYLFCGAVITAFSSRKHACPKEKQHDETICVPCFPFKFSLYGQGKTNKQTKTSNSP